MAKLEENYAQIDPVWDRVRHEALEAVRSEPAVGGFIPVSKTHLTLPTIYSV